MHQQDDLLWIDLPLYTSPEMNLDWGEQAWETWGIMQSLAAPGRRFDRADDWCQAPYPTSHCHFSHLMAIYPLGLLQFDGDSALMTRSVRYLESLGREEWTGHSYGLGDGVAER